MSSSSASSSSKNDAESLRCNRILSSKLYLDVPTSKVKPMYKLGILQIFMMLINLYQSGAVDLLAHLWYLFPWGREAVRIQ